tara:strand:+ start:8151 stop:10061 length:1911 start_codon:yes stop_codon:yes gene_type:complete
MDEKIEDQLAKLEELQAQLEKGAAENLPKLDGENEEDSGFKTDIKFKEGAPSVFMTDIRFKEALDSGELIEEEVYNSLDEQEQKGYEMVNVMDDETKEIMGWAFRFKASGDMKDMFDSAEEAAARAAKLGCEGTHETGGKFMPCATHAEWESITSGKGYGGMRDDDDEDEKSEEKLTMRQKRALEFKEKESAVLSRLMGEADEDEEENPDVPEVFLSKADFDEKCHTGEYLSIKEYNALDEDAKGSYGMVQVYDEDSKKGYGMRYRRRNPLKRNMRYKEKFFDSAEEAAEAAASLGCQGAHEVDGKFMPCENPADYAKLTGQGEAERLERAPMRSMEKGEFLCGFQRKSVNAPCDFCRGGCAPEDGLPGLADVEFLVTKSHQGSEVISSGYSSVDDIFVVDLKREDGSAIEVFLSGEGDELGWLKLDDDMLDQVSSKSIDIISSLQAERIAVKSLGGEAMSVTADVFNDHDVYVVEIEGVDQKSYDVFIGVDGKVLGYDEYEVELPVSEEEEIKALEAELAIKRMYSREQREEMAENGEALPDGSFPIADEADLKNAIQAYGRASDKGAAKAHIMKRAEELGMEELIPATWLGEDAEESAGQAERMADEKGLADANIDLMEALKEFEELKQQDDIS